MPVAGKLQIVIFVSGIVMFCGLLAVDLFGCFDMRMCCTKIFLSHHIPFHNDNTKTTELISTKVGWRIGLGPEWTPLTFGTVPVKGKDPRTL